MGNIVNPGILKGRLLDSAGQPLSGKISVKPDTPIITGLSTVMTSHSIEAELNAFGEFRVELQGNNAADVTPQGFTYRLSYHVFDHDKEFLEIAPFSFAIGEGQTRDLRDIAPISPNTGEPVTSGPVGPAGPEGPEGPAGPASTVAGPAGVPGAGKVNVVTGDEARPDSPLVFWIGGSVQPTNMGLDDLWFSAPPPPDTTAPSIPAGLAATNITQSGFTLTWDPATDNSGVSGYDIFVGTVLKASTTTATTANITGLAPSTTYSVTVTARDVVGNVSAASEPLAVTTAIASGTPRHSIWASNPYPYTITKYAEPSGPITVANAFYSYGTSPDVSAWRVIGARIWVPAGANLPAAATVSAWFGVETMVSAVPATSTTITNWVSGAWNEVIFPGPIETNSGDVVWIGYKVGTSGEYFAVPHTEIGQGFITASDGSHIVLSDDNGSSQRRSQFQIDGTAATHTNPSGYCIDVIYDEGPL